jgi:alpha-beta hydrolase superfamily lysophospholipase
MRRLLKWLGRTLLAAALVIATIVLVRAFDARRQPALGPWHRVRPRSEMRAREMTAAFTLADYLRREEAVFREVREEVGSRLSEVEMARANRFFEGSPLHPSHFATDWNRTFEIIPENIRGGALLIHGLTDSPYSMRRLARILQEEGISVLCLRMPGHGTVPGALTEIAWEDWMAAVRVGARHMRARAGKGRPFFLIGYSSGGGLAAKYALDSLSDPELPKPDRLLLLSPMIGVTRFAGLARLVSSLGSFSYFEKSKWIDILPEYIPFKYNSFPANAAYQSFRLTRALQDEIDSAARSGRISGLAPILAFQSLVDFTVSTHAVVHQLFDRLSAPGSEIVIFDRNRHSDLRPFLPSGSDETLSQLLPAGTRRYAVAIVTNSSDKVLEVVERRTPAGETRARDQSTGLSWPPQTFSLSHIALPFATDDPLYGTEPDSREFYGVRLGVLAPRGERSGLIVGMDQLMRLTCNPFFPYVERRLREWIDAAVSRR